MIEYSKLQNDLRWECRQWWRKLNGVDREGVENRVLAERKSRAELRRIGASASASDTGDGIDLVNAYAVDFFHRLCERVAARGARLDREKVALAAAVLANVEADRFDLDEEGQPWTTAKLLGKQKGNETKEPKFAELRFKRLIRTDDPAELLPQMVRAVKILGKAAPIGELGTSLLLWGPAVKKRWAFAYWQKKYIPAESTEQTETQDAA